MKNLIVLFVLLYIALGCSTKNSGGTIQFLPLTDKDFEYAADTSFATPKGGIWEEKKRIHDSCMGASFNANAIFIRTKDTFELGAIVNRKTMKVVKRFDLRNFPIADVFSLINIVTKPCYERRPLEFPVDSFLNQRMLIKITDADNATNKELNEAIKHSINTEIETGLWMNAELTDALGKDLDTTTNTIKLAYKKELLKPDNMVLIRSSSVTNIKFYINSDKPLSNKLQNILRLKKPATIPDVNLSPELFLLTNSSFEINLNGYFQIMGQFMACKSE